jgi:glycosyltransferase involved in cell wall biosynthesis
MNLAPLALNGRFSGTAQPTGTQTVAFHLYDAIIRAKRERPVVVFADPRFKGVEEWAHLPHTTLITIPFQDWSRHRSQFWEQFAFPLLARRHGCVLAHHPITTCPSWQAGVKTVVTLHDLNFYLHPEWFSRSFRLVLRFFALPGIRRAQGVVTISDYVRGHILDHLHLPPSRVKRIYNGVKFQPDTPNPEAPAASRPPYILCVGSLQPHKNLPRLIRAWLQLRAEQPDLELWVVGRPQPRFSKQPELTELLQSPGIRLLGYLSEIDLAAAYRHARVFCFPSLEEGFGLPLLEAMQAGTLVVTSQASCLPEIGGPACEYIDPLSESSLAQGLRQMLLLPDEKRRQRIEQGRAWANAFSWQRAAREYLDLFEELLK